jgi:hypothetical protein
MDGVTDTAGAPDPQPSSLEDEDLAALWKRFRAGEVVVCDRDHAQIALSVDGASRGYRFVCTQCGRASSWFEDSLGGTFRVRTTTVPHALDDDDSNAD